MKDPTKALGSLELHPRTKAAVLILVLALVCALTLSREFYEQLAADIFFSLTLAGCTIIFFSVRPPGESLQLICVTAALLSLQSFALKISFKFLPTLGLLGLGSLLLLIIRRIWSYGPGRQLLQDSIVPPLLFIVLGYLGSGPLAITGRLHPKTLDLFLYSFDQSLGLQLSFLVGRVVLRSPVFTRIMLVMYYALPIAIMLTYARLLIRDRRMAMAAFLAFLVAGPLGVVFYNLVPACGPAYLVGAKFPYEALSTAQLRNMPLQAIVVEGVRNAFPSLHMGWALLAWWYSQRLSLAARMVIAIFLAGTALSTLGLGEHYFVDLVTAFPFALMIQAACALNVSNFSARKLVPLVAGALLMLAWVVLLRFGLRIVQMSPVVPWMFVTFTITSSVLLQRRVRCAFPSLDQPLGAGIS